MRWQWPARLVVAVIGIGCAAAIFVSTRHRQRPPEPLTSLQTVNPGTVAKGGAGRTLYTKVGKTPISVTFSGTETAGDGRQYLADVVVEGLEGNHFSIHGDRLAMEGPSERPARYKLSGHVVITTDDALHLESDQATYDDTTGHLMIPGPVTFSKGRLSGSAIGGTYERERDAITLLDAATAHVQPDPTGRGAADATSRSMSLARGQHMLALNGNAKIVGDTQVLTADAATFTFTEDERAIKYLELRGGARAAPKPGAATTDQPDLSGDNISMSFHPDGVTIQHATLTGRAKMLITGASARSITAARIDFTAAPDGRTLTQLDANAQVVVELAATDTTRGRTITATTMSAKGDEKKGLTSARFDGAPVFKESGAAATGRGASTAPGAASLEGSATALVLTLGGQLDAIESADFLQNALFHNGDATAKGDLAQYVQATDTVHFSANSREPRKKPSVETQDMRVDGWSIDLTTSTQDLLAKTGVTTVSKASSTSAVKPNDALFKGDQPINGTADFLKYTKSTGTAVYRGGAAQAKLWQGDSVIQADQIEYTDATRNLDAYGSVNSTWLFKPPAGPEPAAAGRGGSDLKKYRVRAETLRYDDAGRTANFKAPTVMLLLPDDGSVESGVLTFQLATGSQTLQEMRAEHEVWVTLPGDYEAVSDSFVYHAETDIYDFYGKPNQVVQLKAPKKDAAPPKDPAHPEPAMCTKTEGLHLVLNKVAGTVQQPGSGEAPRTVDPQFSCAASLKRKK